MENKTGKTSNKIIPEKAGARMKSVQGKTRGLNCVHAFDADLDVLELLTSLSVKRPPLDIEMEDYLPNYITYALVADEANGLVAASEFGIEESVVYLKSKFGKYESRDILNGVTLSVMRHPKAFNSDDEMTAEMQDWYCRFVEELYSTK